MRITTIFTFAITAALGAATARIAAAEPTVLSVDGDDVLVELGRADGATDGAALRLLHVVIARDPVSGQTLRDRFEVGTLTIARAGAHVALAHPEAALHGKVVVGDELELASAPVAFVDPWQQRIAAAAAATPEQAAADAAAAGGDPRAAATHAVDEAAAARAVWQDTLGRPPTERADKWEAYLSGRPDSPYAAAVKAEIASLRAQAASLDRATAARTAAGPGADDDARAHALALALADLVPGGGGTQLATAVDGTWVTQGPTLRDGPLVVDAPTTALPGQPIALAFAVTAPAHAARAWLYVRPRGAAGYQRLPLARDGDAYLRGTIPAALVGASGVEWYVETAAATGAPRAVIGDEAAPRVIDTLPDVTEAPIAPHRSRVAMTLEYVDFDGGLAKGHDQYYQAEFDFTYRFLHPVHAVRLGFGTLSGEGGPKDVIDADPTGQCLDAKGVYQCRKVDFSYVYTEFEWRPNRLVGLMLRPQAGMLTTDRSPTSGPTSRCHDSADVHDCDFGAGVGLRARVRLGAEDGTNLMIGVGVTQGVGTKFEAEYQWAPRPVIPVTLAVQVTNQPVPQDFGVRIIGDVGWRGLGWVYPSVRVSYQARDIDHAGLSGGVGVNFDW